MKCATKLSRARYNTTKNPFIIYGWFDILEKTVIELELQDPSGLTCNADESAYPSEPKKFRGVSGHGQQSLQIVIRSDQEKKTILAAVTANGGLSKPLIIFQGQNVQTT